MRAGNGAEQLQLALGQVVETVVVNMPELRQVGRGGGVLQHHPVQVLAVVGAPLGETAPRLPVQAEQVPQRVPVPGPEMALLQRLQRHVGIHHAVLQVPQALPQGGAGPFVLRHAGEPSPGRAAARRCAPQSFLHERLVAQGRRPGTVDLVEQGPGELGEGAHVEMQQVEAVLLGQEDLHPSAQGVGRDRQQQGRQRVLLPPGADLLRQRVFQLGVVGSEDDLHGKAAGSVPALQGPVRPHESVRPGARCQGPGGAASLDPVRVHS